MRTFPTKEQLMYGHVSQETAYVVDDYPYGYTLRCSIRYWIETSPKFGDRFCSQTINPKKSGEVWNKPKKSTYYKMMFMYKDAEKGHVNWNAIDYSGERGGNEELKNIINFIVNVYGLENFSKEKDTTIRMSYYAHLLMGLRYGADKYSEGAKREEFAAWTKATCSYVAKCDFKAICDHAAPPPQDCKDGEPLEAVTLQEGGQEVEF